MKLTVIAAAALRHGELTRERAGTMRESEGIWVEATKLSAQDGWLRQAEPTAPTRTGVYAKFPPHGPRRDVELHR
jgi:hypothetical protein